MPFWRSATSHFTQHMCVFYTNTVHATQAFPFSCSSATTHTLAILADSTPASWRMESTHMTRQQPLGSTCTTTSSLLAGGADTYCKSESWKVTSRPGCPVDGPRAAAAAAASFSRRLRARRAPTTAPTEPAGIAGERECLRRQGLFFAELLLPAKCGSLLSAPGVQIVTSPQPSASAHSRIPSYAHTHSVINPPPTASSPLRASFTAHT